MRREICGDCGSPISDDGACDCAELIKRGWRQCAVGQKATQWCAEAERVRGELREQRQRDEDLLRQVLEALGWARQTAMVQTLKARIPECGEFARIAQDLDFAVAALRERLGHRGEHHATVF